MTTPPATLTRTRRRARALLTTTGTINLLSAVTPPFAARLAFLDAFVPLNARESAAAIAALFGVMLLVLAGGLRRGAHRAWVAALAILVVSVVANVVKGLDLEEAIASTTLAVYLVLRRHAFHSRTDPTTTRRTVHVIVSVLAASAAAAAVLVAMAASRQRPLHLHAIVVTMKSTLGQAPFGTKPHQGLALGVVLAAIAVGTGTWALLRPTRLTTTTSLERVRARAIIDRYSSGTLDYFTLRDDKQLWVHDNTVVAYKVLNSVCLVSPDPVGPAADRADIWRHFQRHVDTRGWSIAVLGATGEWLPIYRQSGMRAVYLGDEAIVDVTTFRLDGGQFKGLRQAVNRVARRGYTLELTDPTKVDPITKGAILELAAEGRRGDRERGFSMTLGRLFDPSDEGLLLAVVRGPNGHPVAFCQFVPAPAIGGYSLDLMRRSRADHPNGLLDFLLVGTIKALAERGTIRLSLNFAAVRAILASEDRRFSHRAVRAVAGRLGRSLQIESLWRFNAKYDPEWSPRYLLIDASDRIGPVGLAALRAEQSVNELPILGRLLAPAHAARLAS